MAKTERIFRRILSGVADRIFVRDGIEEIINLQPKGGKAKAYQVKQVRNIVVKYGLSLSHEE